MTDIVEMNLVWLNTVQEIPDEEDDDFYPIISGRCQSCIHTPASSRFLHLDGREFFLCEYCFWEADHESDYGKDFQPFVYEYNEQCNEYELEDIGHDDCYNSDSDEEEWIDVKLKSLVG